MDEDHLDDVDDQEEFVLEDSPRNPGYVSEQNSPPPSDQDSSPSEVEFDVAFSREAGEDITDSVQVLSPPSREDPPSDNPGSDSPRSNPGYEQNSPLPSDNPGSDPDSAGDESSEDDDESWIGSEPEEHEHTPYYELLQAISEKWLIVELNHSTSKAASNAFWDLATSLLPSLANTKTRLGVSKKIPQFVHLRRKLHKQYVPQIHRTITYQEDGKDDLIEIPHHIQFQPLESQKKVYETASVKLSKPYLQQQKQLIGTLRED